MVFSNKLISGCSASGDVWTTRTPSRPWHMREAPGVLLLRSDFSGKRHAQACLHLRTQTYLLHEPRMPLAYQSFVWNKKDRTLCRGLFCSLVKLESVDGVHSVNKRFSRPGYMRHRP